MARDSTNLKKLTLADVFPLINEPFLISTRDEMRQPKLIDPDFSKYDNESEVRDIIDY